MGFNARTESQYADGVSPIAMSDIFISYASEDRARANGSRRGACPTQLDGVVGSAYSTRTIL